MKPTRHSTSRREAIRTLFAASIGAMLPTPPLAKPPARASESTHEGYHFRSIRERVLQAVAHGEATGVAVAVAQGGRIIWQEGFGWANREAGLKVTAHTPFSLASITKPFTTTTLMTLVAEGKISLDEPANKYLLKSKLEGLNGNPDEATIRRLGAHAGGLPSMFKKYDRDEPTRAPSAETLLRDYGRLAYPPGGCYEYSNIGFVAMSAIASNVTGTEFGALMTQRVLAPLGLRDSFFVTNAPRLRISAVRYDDSGNPIPYYTTSTPASGELYASAHDLARFAMFNLKNPLKGRPRILDDPWIDELHKPVWAGPSGVATTFGWFSGHTKSGRLILFKGGGQPGVATILYMVPSENLACLVLTNRSDGSKFALSLSDQILTTILPEWTHPDERIDPPNAPFVVTPEFAGRWEGTLTNGGADMRVKVNLPSREIATLSLANKPAEKIVDMQFGGKALTAKSVGVIESPDAIRNKATMLSLKLLPKGPKLVGRILATAKRPGTVLPYVLTLQRQPS